MKRFWKVLLRALGILFLLVVLFIVFAIWSMKTHKAQFAKDMEAQSKLCDTMSIVKEQPQLTLIGFETAEIDTLQFQILRNRTFIRDTLITAQQNDYDVVIVNIPYPHFLKTDTIILTTKNQLHYYISGFHHTVEAFYGMTGPVAMSDCFLAKRFTINNIENTNNVSKIEAWVNPEKSKSVRLIRPSGDAYKELTTQLPINKAAAEAIFKQHKENPQWGGLYMYGIEQGKEASYYLLGEKMDDDHIDIIKINAETGEYKRYKHYPFDH